LKVRRVFIVVPSLIPTGPIKGAAALCNNLIKHLPVTLVILKPAIGDGIAIEPNVQLLHLGHFRRWKDKYYRYRDILHEAGGREYAVSISYGLSSDILNLFMRRHAIIISSVRGNLPKNYRYDYGWPGFPVSLIHLLLLRRFDRVVSMSYGMTQQLCRFGIRRLTAIANFLDETHLEQFKIPFNKTSDSIRFVFLASLSKRKRPELVINAIANLRKQGIDCWLDIIGDGPLRSALTSIVVQKGLSPYVIFHGQLNHPYEILQKSDGMVLPSESEGTPRAAMEALFFGIPCILRDVDANRDLIIHGENGMLFSRDEELTGVMASMIKTLNQDKIGKKENLLPSTFRQDINVQKFMELIYQ